MTSYNAIKPVKKTTYNNNNNNKIFIKRREISIISRSLLLLYLCAVKTYYTKFYNNMRKAFNLFYE